MRVFIACVIVFTFVIDQNDTLLHHYSFQLQLFRSRFIFEYLYFALLFTRCNKVLFSYYHDPLKLYPARITGYAVANHPVLRLSHDPKAWYLVVYAYKHVRSAMLTSLRL